MLLSKEVKPREREKTIKVVLYFWTDELAEKKGYIKPKVCWDYGVVNLPANSSHGITASEAHFSRPSKILLTIEKLFKKQGIKMVHGNRSEESGELYTSM